MTRCPLTYGRDFAVSAGHPLAAQAAYEVLRVGGNAVDAGVAAGIALGVLESELVSFAGVAPIMLYDAQADRLATISGVGPWPAATDIRVFEEEYGGTIPTGILRTVVPAAPDAWITALQRFGTMGFADVAAHAIDFARHGFHMYPLMAELVEKYRETYAQFPANRAIYLPGGAVPRVGEVFVQPELAATLSFMADEDRAAARRGGRDAGLTAARAAFYTGDIARTIVDFHKAEGGWMREADLAGFSVEVEPPLATQFRDWEVFGCGPWCQGIMLLESLAILDGVALEELDHNGANYLHLVTETIKIAAADRERYLGDPHHVDVPIDRLLSPDFIAARRAAILPAEAAPDMPEPGEIAPDPPAEGQLDTSYVCVVDASGNAFSATPSDGSFHAPVLPGLGFVVSPRGQQSWVDRAHPSRVAPGRRPRLTPNPAIAMSREHIMPFGSPGGDVQTQAMLQAFLNHVVYGLDIQSAIEAPRVASYSFPSSFAPHGSEPGVLRTEGRLATEVRAELARFGHNVTAWPEWSWLAGSVSMIEADRAGGTRRAAADPRRAACALAR